ncbi:MAG TPA: DUF6011 domain-containing protein [bacterium]|nr:DUF6011 domain-containing protein [bacterium]
MIIHYPNCRADYPEKPKGEPARHAVEVDLGGGETALQCADCGASEVVRKPAKNSHKFQDAGAAARFALAGDAVLTLRSLRTGTRYTYRVRLADGANPDSLFRTALSAERRWFVSLLVGPENTRDYAYLGTVSGEVPVFRLTRKSKMSFESGPARAARFFFECLARGAFPPGLEVWHEGRCGRCGRLLTVPESVEAGIGPDCAGRMGL